MNEVLAGYETSIGSVRHEQNLGEFKKISATLNKQDGSFTTVKVLGTLLAFLCMAILALLSYLAANRSSHSAITVNSDATVADSFDATNR